MRKFLAGLLVLCFSTVAVADNYQATQGTGTFFAAKNISSVLYPWFISTNSSGTELWTTANPGSVVILNTVSVNCTSGCSAAGASSAQNIVQWGSSSVSSLTTWSTAPATTATVLNANTFVTNTVSTSPTGNTPVTGSVSQSGNWQVGLGTTSTSPIFDSITNTVSVSPTGNTPVTGSVGITGTVSTSPTGTTPVGITGTVSTSPTGTTPITGTITGTVSTSPTGNTPVTGAVAQSGNWQVGLGTTSTSQIFVAGNVGAALGTTQASPIYSQLTTSTSAIGSVTVINQLISTSSQSGNWQVGLGTTSASPIFVGGNVGAALGTTQASPIFSQLTTSTSAIGSVTVLNTVSTSPAGTVPISGIVNMGSGATATIGNAVPTSAVFNGEKATNAEQTAGSNGNLIGLVADLVGRLIVTPYTNKENLFTFAISSTTSAPTILVPSFGQGVYPYITSLSCYFTGSNAAASSSQIITLAMSPTAAQAGVATISPIFRVVLGNTVSGTGFYSAQFPTPLAGVSMGTQNSNVNVYMRGTDAGAAFTGQMGCNVSGYKGT